MFLAGLWQHPSARGHIGCFRIHSEGNYEAPPEVGRSSLALDITSFSPTPSPLHYKIYSQSITITARYPFNHRQNHTIYSDIHRTIMHLDLEAQSAEPTLPVSANVPAIPATKYYFVALEASPFILGTVGTLLWTVFDPTYSLTGTRSIWLILPTPIIVGLTAAYLIWHGMNLLCHNSFRVLPNANLSSPKMPVGVVSDRVPSTCRVGCHPLVRKLPYTRYHFRGHRNKVAN